jgi:6-phosphofructokinase 1
MTESQVKKIGVLTSGGDSPGMNAAIRAVVRTANYYHLECFGIREGYSGLMEGNLTKMGARSVKNIINQGGTILKSARSLNLKLKKEDKKLLNNVRKLV